MRRRSALPRLDIIKWVCQSGATPENPHSENSGQTHLYINFLKLESVGRRRRRRQDVDCYSQIVRFQFVDSDDNSNKCRVQWAVGLKISRHIDAHSNCVMTCISGKIQTVL